MKPYELISAAIEAAKTDDRIGLIPFITAGYPEPAGFLNTLRAVANIGDVVEIV